MLHGMNSADDDPVVPEFRRDSAPPRGPLLLTLALISVIVSITSVFGLPALVAVGLGLAVYFMARHDLKLIEEGRLDPQGSSHTESAQRVAVAAIAVSVLLGTLPCFMLLGMIVRALSIG
jgi:uncharacterized membrane protein